MAEYHSDDLADALAKLAAGEVAPSAVEPEPLIGEPPQDTLADRIARPPMPAEMPAPPVIPPAPPRKAYTSTTVKLPQPESDFTEALVEDDQVEIAQAQSIVITPAWNQARKDATQRAMMYQTLEFRRTLIPVLLVCGLLMILFAVSKYLVNAESPISALPVTLTAALFIMGAILLALAVLNMISVRDRLRQYQRLK